MTPEQEAEYAFSYGSRADLKSDAARDAFDRLAAARAARTAAQPLQPDGPPLHSRPAPGKPRAALHAGRLVTAVVVFVTGLVLMSATASRAALCSSGIGEIAQGFSGKVYADCSAWTGVHEFGTFLFWLGLAGTAVLGIMTAVENNRRSAGRG